MRFSFRGILKLILLVFVVVIVARISWALIGGDEHQAKSGDSIAVYSLTGVIYDSDHVIEALKSFEEDDAVKGIIIRIDSPGGLVTPSQELYDYILTMKKPVYAAMGNIAASGGYYVAIATGRIYAMPSTVTGSIGVIMNMSNYAGLQEKLGIQSVVIKSGKYKDIGSPDRPMTEDETALLNEVVMDMYDQFAHAVSARRQLSMDRTRELADGRIFTGRMAKEVKLVDKVGSWRDALTDMKKDLNLPDAEMFEYEEEEDLTFIEKIIDWLDSSSRSFIAPEGLYFMADFRYTLKK